MRMCSVITHIISEDKLKQVTNISYVDEIDNTVKIYNSNVSELGKYHYTTGEYYQWCRYQIQCK